MMEKENHIVIDEAAAEQLVEFISGPIVPPPKAIKRMGAATMAERQAARAAGLTILEWRAQQQKGR